MRLFEGILIIKRYSEAVLYFTLCYVEQGWQHQDFVRICYLFQRTLLLLGVEARVSCMLSTDSTTELYYQANFKET